MKILVENFSGVLANGTPYKVKTRKRPSGDYLVALKVLKNDRWRTRHLAISNVLEQAYRTIAKPFHIQLVENRL